MRKNLKLFLLTVLGTWMAGSAMAEEHYLVGGCTDSGWETGSYHRIGVAMMRVNTDTWVWYGKLTTGEGDNGRFKIPNSIGGWDGYWAPAQGTVLTSEWSDLSTSGDGDYKYCVSEAGLYKVTINTSTKKIKAEKLGDGPQKDGDYYLIGSVADFCWFAAYVATNETNASKARLTADLDFSNDGFFPLASDKHKFKGEIDGAGHTVSGINVVEDYGFTALVRYATGGAYIHDLVIEGSFSGGRKVAGVIGFARDGGEVKLTNVINKANVTATEGSSGDEGNAAGLVACAVDNTIITALNCANMGAVSGQDGQCAAFLGWSQSGTTFTNCWNSGSISNIDGSAQLYRNSDAVTPTNCYDFTDVGNQGTKKNATDLSTAEFCYALNGNISGGTDWYLTIGTDTHPYPFVGQANHGIVYANGSLYCDGEPQPGAVLENEEKTAQRDAHAFNDWGFCTNAHDSKTCNEFNQNMMTPVADGFYEINDVKELNWFAVKVTGHDTYHSHINGVRDINGRLKADIDFSGQTNMIGGDGNSTAYTGTFDGQGHRVKVAYSVNQKNAALFRTISNAHIKNLITEGTINNLSSCSGGIFAGSHGASVVENCVSYVTFTRKEGDNSNGGDATIGGIGAYMHDTGKISNCAFYGSIETPNANGNGGLLGYANGGDNNKIEYCVVAATLSYTNEHLFARNTNSITSCYYVNTGKTYSNATEVTATQVASGELAYMLNGNSSDNVTWYQKLGTDADAQPLPFGTDATKVYANGDLYCDGTSKGTGSFSNTEGSNRDAHIYNDWGFCGNKNGSNVQCNALQPDFMTTVSGVFEIANEKQLNWFAHYVCEGNLTDDVKLMNDIDMANVNGFPGIGNESNAYKGTFDGQKHHIKNMTITGDANNYGLFRLLGGGAKVMNLTLDANCNVTATGKERIGGFAGGIAGSSGEKVEFINCGNEANVTSNKNSGGFVGCNATDVTIHLTNCYNIGTIKGGESGGISGWVNRGAQLRNCYNMGAVDGTDYFVRMSNGSGESLINCFDTKSTWNALSSTVGGANAFDVGTVFATCFDDAQGGSVWRMDFDATPAHPVLYEPATLVLKEDFPNRFVAGETADVKVYRAMTGGDTDWNTLCLPFNADASLFSAIAELTGVSGSTLQFTSGVTTIEAGKAYLVKPVADITTIEATGVELKAAEPTTFSGTQFVGIYAPTVLNEGDIYVTAGNHLKAAPANASALKGFRGYFTTTSGARFDKFVVDDDTTTGIIGIDGTVIENGKIYNLNGQKVQNAQKGLYIVNGKKVVVK